MTPTEQAHSSLSVTSPTMKSPEIDTLKNSRLPTTYSGDIYAQYNTPTTTQMMINSTYSPVPGVQNGNTLYSSTYNQYGNGAHHQAAILPSPPFIHSNIGSPSPSVASGYSNHPHHPQHYTNAAAAISALSLTFTQSQPFHHPSIRTVYLGNLTPDMQVSDILDQVRVGVLETVRPLPEKNCLFLTFIEASAATQFYHDFTTRPLMIHGVELKVGWGKPTVLPTNIRQAIQSGASRNVFLGSLDESVNEDVIREDLKRFGTIEHVRLIREKNIAFVHFLSISNAIKCVNSLPNEGDWQNRRVYYGKDRCCPNNNNNNNNGNINNNINNNDLITTNMVPSSALISSQQQQQQQGQPPTTIYTNNTGIPTIATSTYPSHLPPTHYHHSHSPHHHPQSIHVQHTYQVRYPPPSITYDPYTGTTIETYPTTIATASPITATVPQITPLQPSVTAVAAGTHTNSHQPLPPTTATTIIPTISSIAGSHNTSNSSSNSSHHSGIGGDMTIYSTPSATLLPNLTATAAGIPPPPPTNLNNLAGVANRTIYLGNIHPDTTCEEICNVIRGGILSQIRYMGDKHIAFIAFVDPALALHFYTQASYQGIVIKNRRLKIGWGKPSSLPLNVIQAVQNGGSRNVYLGNMDDSMTEEKLKQDFSEYGDIELINTLKEKNCAFVNFTSITAAIRAIEGIRNKEEYKKFRINYGKDRCGNPPRSLQQQQQQQNQQSQQPSVLSTSDSINLSDTPSMTVNTQTTLVDESIDINDENHNNNNNNNNNNIPIHNNNINTNTTSNNNNNNTSTTNTNNNTTPSDILNNDISTANPNNITAINSHLNLSTNTTTTENDVDVDANNVINPVLE
ncbi:unnamed protein product [Cunninghamella blakesleeana]